MRTQTVSGYPAPTRASNAVGGLAVAVGEIRTGLLRHSGSLPKAAVAELIDLVPGEPVRQSERPIAHALSADVANGVDCLIPAGSGARVRAVGTVLTHAAVVGGRVLQTSSYTRIDPAGAQRRLAWSHYTARPGQLETLNRADPRDLCSGYLAQDQVPDCLDLGSISERLARRMQSSPLLDGRQPLRFQWTRLRWTALYGAEPGTADRAPAAQFTLESDTVRTLSLLIPRPAPRTALSQGPDVLLDAILELCRDLALHDWVLTTVTRRIERTDLGAGDRARAVEELRPAIDHLLHLWMPGARVADELAAIWDGFERRPGFTRQWEAAVARVRDQLALHTLQLLATLSMKDAGSTTEY